MLTQLVPALAKRIHGRCALVKCGDIVAVGAMPINARPLRRSASRLISPRAIYGLIRRTPIQVRQTTQ